MAALPDAITHAPAWCTRLTTDLVAHDRDGKELDRGSQ